MKNASITIRMGAAHWDATLATGEHFDFRKMKTPGRKQWYGAFMDSVRAVMGRGAQRRRRSKARGCH